MTAEIKLVNASLIELQQLKEELLARLNRLTRSRWTGLDLPKEPDPAWCQEAIDAHRRYHAVVETEHKRRRVADARHLSRFIQECNSPDGLSPEMKSWWWHRY